MKYALLILVIFMMSCSGPSSNQADLFHRACWERWLSVKKDNPQIFAGTDGWLFFGPELRHVGGGVFWGPEAANLSRATRPDYADPLPAIVDFAHQLRELDIELLVVPVPPKAVVYPDKLLLEDHTDFASSERLDPFHQAFYDLLREEGIAVLDLLPRFLAERSEGDIPLYCKTDTHWSGRGCVVAAEEIAAEILKRGWYVADERMELISEWNSIQIAGDLNPSARETGDKEKLDVRFVWQKSGESRIPIAPDRSSPILLLGDSHDLVFHAGDDMHARGAGLPDQLALELGRAVDLVAVRGSGATPARINLMRRARSDKNYLKAKKLVIWCFGAREFTESSGWQKVPLS